MVSSVRFRPATAAVALLATTLCGSGDAFVAGGGGGAVASMRTARASKSAFTPMCRGRPRSGLPVSITAMTLGWSPATSRPLFGGGTSGAERGQASASSSSALWRQGLREPGAGVRAAGGHGSAAAENEEEESGEGGAEAREGGGRGWEVGKARDVRPANRRRFSRPAAVLRFVREAVEYGARKAGKGARARITDWRRRMSVALIGVAAAFVIMTSAAGPAQALFGIPARQQEAPARYTNMPESVYVQREQLQDFCATPPQDRLFDFDDLTTYDEELDKLNMFADNIAPSMGARESFRLKYIRHAEDQLQKEAGSRTQGVYGAINFIVKSSVTLGVAGAVVVSILWTYRKFIEMSREEEVFLYGEEISVDATEKPEESLEDLDEDEDLDIDEENLEDYSTPASGASSNPSPPSTPPPGSGRGGDAGGSSDEDDDLLGL